MTLDLARLLKSAGYNVFVADSMKHNLCTTSRFVCKNFVVPPPKSNPSAYIAALKEIITEANISFLIPTCEEIFYISHGLRELTPYCQVFAENIKKLNRLHNKWEFICSVQKIGLTAPQTWLIESQQELTNLLNLPTPKKLVLKPVYSRFASYVQILSKPLNTIPKIQINPQKTWVAQEFIEGTHYCSYSIAHEGKLTAHAVYPTIFTAGLGSCIYFEAVNHEQIIEWVKKFVEAENFTGQIAFDFIEASDGNIYPLECNPRAISAIHLFQPADKLETAFFNQTTYIIQPEVKQSAMIAMAMLIYGLPSAILSNRLFDWLKMFTQTRDVIFSLSDPLPFFYLNVMLWQTLKMSIKTKLSLQQVSTQDIEWDGEKVIIHE